MTLWQLWCALCLLSRHQQNNSTIVYCHVIYVASLSFRPDVICLSESCINQPLKSIQLHGYNFINAKPNKQAGGTAIYVCSKLKFSQIDGFGLTGSESIWLKIWKNDLTKVLVIASIYRHPSEDINQFICDFSDCLEKLSNEKKTFTFLVT